ncbi:5'-nucleotidase domain-containing protein 3-like [Liolophura sinensis]|uniref:5'-nucleotidase domain-containing protein 3-like n=1 Tax=Liolophura sinensis TaxID=3198878 RepID=UPI003159143C
MAARCRVLLQCHRKFCFSGSNLGNLCCFSSSATSQGRPDLWEVYNARKDRIKAKELPISVNPAAVFANNEVKLEDIDVYGFDYDYTLASYKPELHHLLYNLGAEALIKQYRYPEEILHKKYDPNFAVRGLHFDVRKGLLMKLDSFHNIQLGTVYRGYQPVTDEEVKALYEGTHVPLTDMNTFYGTGLMHQLVDLFAPPEMTLLAHVLEHLNEKGIVYDPEYVFYDVRNAVQGVHSSGLLHGQIMSNLDLYLEKGEEVKLLLMKLTSAGKKLFLITNSGFQFVDSGMKYMIGQDWEQLFDVIITSARKPKFFNESSRPFRLFDKTQNRLSWDRVSELKKGEIYQQGNFYLFRQMKGWYGSEVLYFGDHVYSDLADPSLKFGWRTGAIIPELEEEIQKLNTEDYKFSVRWITALQYLIEEMQVYNDPQAKEIQQAWVKERDELRAFTKDLFNNRFGSLFRTYHNPTYFTRRLCRFADLYMSNLTNLLNYSVNHTFYPKRAALPHEAYPKY